METLLTVREVAHLLALKPSTVYEWAAKGKLPCYRLGGRLRFAKDEIVRWLGDRRQ